MYQLTLTLAERKAIDWIGGRYAHGNYLYKLLWVKSDCNPNDADWDDPRPITFTIPENIAWCITEIGDECDYNWDCFGNELSDKLTKLCHEVI